jgi:hypothetical protein
LRGVGEVDGSFAVREVKIDCCGWSYKGKGRDMDEGRVAGGRRPGFNFFIELFAGPEELFNGVLAV